MSVLKPLQVIQFSPNNPIGFLQHHLIERLGSYRVITPDHVDLIQSDAPMILLGSPQSVNDEHLDWLRISRKRVEEALEMDTPMFGICFGAQLIANILGSAVVNVDPEFGWYPVRCTETQTETTVFQWHEQGFRCPSSSQELFSGKNQPICQGFKYQRSIATQFHCEVDQMTIQKWVENLKNKDVKSCIEIQTDDYLHSNQRLGLSLVNHWLDLSGL